MNNPIISVLLPVYNCSEYIKESVESILNQTFSDFEILIIDDSSTDGTYEFLQTLTDSRIRLISKSKNTGYTNSLNIGIEIAKGEYIARMDGDDICLPERFEKQINFLKKNEDYVLCGTWFKIFGNESARIIENPVSDVEIKLALLEYCSIGHPTVMIRNSVLKNNNIYYDIEMEPAEDFDLWVRLSPLGKFANLPEVHLNYRDHEKQISNTAFEIQRNNANKCRIKMLCLHVSNLPENSEIPEIILNIKPISNFNTLLEILYWRENIIYNEGPEKNKIEIILNTNIQKAVLYYFANRKKWDYIILKEYFYVKKIIPIFSSLPDKTKFLIKCLSFYKLQNIKK